MNQETILEYARQYLSYKIEKIRTHLDSDSVSPFQRNVFQSKIEKYSAEYKEVSEMIKEYK